MNRLAIPGVAGNIEAAMELVDESRKGAVVCHPHPLYGGSMHDGVVGSLCDGFRAGDVSTLRFNFRGVGGSEGRHDQGQGEVQDVVMASRWFRENCPPTILYLAGYSFGAGVALRAAPQIDCQAIVLVAPPLQMMDALELTDKPTMVILGGRDNIVDCAALREFFDDYPNVRLEVIHGADHFFMGEGERIATHVTEFVSGT